MGYRRKPSLSTAIARLLFTYTAFVGLLAHLGAFACALFWLVGKVTSPS